MAVDGKLIFIRPHDGTGRLVFGDDVEAVIPPAQLGVDADFADDMPADVKLLWDANVSREEMVQCRVHWQDATPERHTVGDRWQEGERVTVGAGTRWHDAAPAQHLAAERWQEGQRLISSTSARWQDATELRHAAAEHWQEETRLRHTAAARWQDATELRHLVREHWQEQLRLRHVAGTQWQDASELRRILRQHSGPAIELRIGVSTRWQDASRPPPGQSIVIQPEPPKPDPCYDPAALGTLIFSEPWAPGDGKLVFVCTRTSAPGAAIVVPVRRCYVVHNNVTLYRVPSGAEFPATSFTLDIDADSWTFSWSASLHHSARAHLTRPAPGERVDVQAVVNGVGLRLVVETIGRDRSFPEDRIAVSGRGRAAFLGDQVQTFGNAEARTAQQLMQEVLTINGVSMGWTVDWQITDWSVPGGIWLFRGSHIDALKDIASAAGAYIQPHLTDQVLRVLPRYPLAPWDWASDLTPDIELPVAATSVEGIEEVIRPDFNQVHVGGTIAPAVFGPVKRAGTPGDKEAEQVLHPLITAAPAFVQRGRAILSDTGTQEHVTVQTLVLPETGIIMPGTVVSYVSDDKTRLGIVRKTGLQMQEWPVLRQSLGLETHVFLD